MYVTFDLNLLQIQFVDLQSPKILIGHDHIQLNQGVQKIIKLYRLCLQQYVQKVVQY